MFIARCECTCVCSSLGVPVCVYVHRSLSLNHHASMRFISIVPKTLSLSLAFFLSLTLSRACSHTFVLSYLTGLEGQDATGVPEFPTMNQQGGSFCFESLAAPSYGHQLSNLAHNLNHYGTSAATLSRSEDGNWIAMLM